MTTYKLLHCADLHLDSPLRGLAADPEAPTEQIRGATRQAFTALVDFALEQGVAAVLIAGDLYDGDWKDWRTGQFLMRELSRLTQAGIRAFAISGNHDAESEITRKLNWPDGARLFRADMAESETIEALGLSVHGRGFAQRDVSENLALSYPPAVPGMLNIGLLHTAADGREGHAPYAPCTLDHLVAKGYDYWALGHVHTREILCEDPWIVFPGNLQGRHIRETGSKGATLISVIDGRIAGVRHVPLDVLRWARLEIDLAGAGDEDSAWRIVRARLAEAAAGAEGRLLAARVQLSGATPAHAALMRDPAATREKLRGEALSAGGAGLWLEDVRLLTTGPRAAVVADGMGVLLMAHLEAARPASVAPQVAPFLRDMLDKSGGLAALLGEDDPLVRAARGDLDEALFEQARALLLANLGA